jgi:hypothetical protein
MKIINVILSILVCSLFLFGCKPIIVQGTNVGKIENVTYVPDEDYRTTIIKTNRITLIVRGYPVVCEGDSAYLFEVDDWRYFKSNCDPNRYDIK